MPGKVPGEGHLRRRLFPGHESVSGPGYLWRSDVSPRGRISPRDRNGEGKELASVGQRELLPEAERRKGEGVERCCVPELLSPDSHSELALIRPFWL